MPNICLLSFNEADFLHIKKAIVMEGNAFFGWRMMAAGEYLFIVCTWFAIITSAARSGYGRKDSARVRQAHPERSDDAPVGWLNYLANSSLQINDWNGKFGNKHV